MKFYIRHGMIVDKNHETFLFKQSWWLAKYINFMTQKRNRAKNEFKKDFYKLLNIAFYGKTRKNVKYRLRLEFFKKYEYEKVIKQQSKLTFAGNHKSYQNCDCYLFKKMK